MYIRTYMPKMGWLLITLPTPSLPPAFLSFQHHIAESHRGPWAPPSTGPGAAPGLGVQAPQPLVNEQTCPSGLQPACRLCSESPSPLPAAPVSTLSGISEHHCGEWAVCRQDATHKRLPVSNYSEHFYEKMEALTWKSLQEAAYHSGRSVSSRPRQSWVWAHVLHPLDPEQVTSLLRASVFPLAKQG